MKHEKPLDAVQVLRMLEQDIKEMTTHSVSGPLVLIPKADVLELVRDWREHCLNPDDTTLAKADC